MRRILLAVVISLSPASASLNAETLSPEGVKFFESKIRPVLVERCYSCHSAEAVSKGKLEGELLLDTREGMHRGGESGAAVVPGKVDRSLIIAAIKHESVEMPPDTKLPKQTIDDFEKWIEMGAPDPRDDQAVKIEKNDIDIDAARAFRSFQPLKTTPPPAVSNEAWIRTDIDRFIIASLNASGLTPNKEASRRTLIRRVYFDLWGLPPDPLEVESFVNDSSPDAYEKLVDKLLAGQHYGERWARHWLDLARFAESNGYAFDKDRPAAFHYRDFVIKALNDDMPYDRFVRLQIAGDLLQPSDPTAQAATGFLAAGPFTTQQTQKERERSRYEQLDDVVGTIGTTMLGLTIGCARCHDHKFDPLPTSDYYRFTSSFAATGFQDYDYDPDPAGTKAAKAKFDAEHKPLVDARIKFEKEQLRPELDQWLASSKEPPSHETLSDWHHVGPFPADDFKKAYNTAFAPEKGVDLAKEVDGKKWTPHPTWKDGQVHNTLTGGNSANYLFRTIEVAQKGPLAVSLGHDDAIKVFLNGKQVLAKEVLGGAAADQSKVTLQLKAGKNDLLIKIVNGGGPSGFYFSTTETIPKNIQDIINLAADKRNPKQQQALLKWYAPRDPDWTKLNQAEQEHLKKQPKPKITKIFAARKNGATYNFGADTRKVYFLARGNSNAKKGLASPGFLRVLTVPESGERWLADGSNKTSSNAGSSRVGQFVDNSVRWKSTTGFAGRDLVIRLVNEGGAQINWDNVRLTATTGPDQMKILNESFELPAMANGGVGVPTNWTISGTGGGGHWNPVNGSYDKSSADGGSSLNALGGDGDQVGYSNGGEFEQILTATIADNTEYELTVAVGDRKDIALPAWRIQLLTDGGSTLLAETRSGAQPTGQREPRVAVADWLTDDQQGAGHLLARVIVNRLWQHHMGRGIVATPSDFGSQGAAPTHPELLDYLASELIRHGWKLKPIHKLIMTSAVYRQSGDTNDAAAKTDPENQLWWRRGATRLEAEVIRDTLLSVSGSLDKKMFGAGSLDQASPRRSVYLRVKRSNLIPFLQLFDAPDSIQSIGHRDITTVPPQALAMMNSPLVRQLAEKFAKRVRPDAARTHEQVVKEAYALTLSRPPGDTELARMTGFIASQSKAYGGNEQAISRAVVDYCQMMFCLNEFIFVD